MHPHHILTCLRLFYLCLQLFHTLVWLFIASPPPCQSLCASHCFHPHLPNPLVWHRLTHFNLAFDKCGLLHHSCGYPCHHKLISYLILLARWGCSHPRVADGNGGGDGGVWHPALPAVCPLTTSQSDVCTLLLSPRVMMRS